MSEKSSKVHFLSRVFPWTSLQHPSSPSLDSSKPEWKSCSRQEYFLKRPCLKPSTCGVWHWRSLEPRIRKPSQYADHRLSCSAHRRRHIGHRHLEIERSSHPIARLIIENVFKINWKLKSCRQVEKCNAFKREVYMEMWTLKHCSEMKKPILPK